MADLSLLLVLQMHYAPVMKEAFRPALHANAVVRRLHNFIWNLFAAPLDCHWPVPQFDRHWRLAISFGLPDVCALAMVSRTVHAGFEGNLLWEPLPVLRAFPSFQQWQELRQVMHLVHDDAECPFLMQEFIHDRFRDHAILALELAMVHVQISHLGSLR